MFQQQDRRPERLPSHFWSLAQIWCGMEAIFGCQLAKAFQKRARIKGRLAADSVSSPRGMARAGAKWLSLVKSCLKRIYLPPRLFMFRRWFRLV